MKTNLIHYLSSVYFVNQPLRVSGIFVAHHQEVYYIYIYSNWYVLTRPTDSQLKSTTRTNYCIYKVCLVMMGYKYARNV